MKLKLDGKSSIMMLIVGGILGLGISGMIYGIEWDQKMQESKICEDNSYYNSKKQQKDKDFQNKSWTDTEWEDWAQWGEDVGEYWENWGKNAGEYWSHYGQEMASNITNDVMDSVKNSMTFEKDCLLSRQDAEKIARKYIEEKTGKNLEKEEMDLYLDKWSGWVNQGEWRGSIVADEKTRYGFTVDVESEEVTDFYTYTRNKAGEPWKTKNSSGEVEQIVDEQLNHFNKVNINLDSQINVCLTEGKGYGIKHYQLGEKYQLEYEVEGDTLYIKQDLKKADFNNSHQEDWLSITIPKGAVLTYTEVKEDAGDVDVLNIHVKEMKLDINAGNVNIEEVEVDELYAEVNTGNTFIDETKIKNGVVENKTGNIFIEEVEATKSLKGMVETGNIFLDGNLKGTISVHSKLGNISNDSKNSKDCDLETKVDMGNIF